MQAQRDTRVVLVEHHHPQTSPSGPGLLTGHLPVDLADALISGTATDRPSSGAVLEVLTDAGTPSLPALILRQASLHPALIGPKHGPRASGAKAHLASLVTSTQ